MSLAILTDEEVAPLEEPLVSFGCGKCLRVSSLGLDTFEAERLREMGLCEGRCVAVLRAGDQFIVRSGGGRIGLHRELAERIYGTPAGEEPVWDMRKWIPATFKRLLAGIAPAGRRVGV